MKILIRNLNRDTSEKHLRELFEPFGTIAACDIVMDDVRGRSKGFGFVEMPSTSEAKKAIEKLNGKLLHGVTIRVKITKK